jgi:hypothetical protein
MNFTLRTGKYLIEAPQGIQFGIYENEPIEWISKFFGTYKNGDTITLSGQYGRRRLVTKRSYELYIGDPHGAKQGFAVLFHPI